MDVECGEFYPDRCNDSRRLRDCPRAARKMAWPQFITLTSATVLRGISMSIAKPRLMS